LILSPFLQIQQRNLSSPNFVGNHVLVAGFGNVSAGSPMCFLVCFYGFVQAALLGRVFFLLKFLFFGFLSSFNVRG